MQYTCGKYLRWRSVLVMLRHYFHNGLEVTRTTCNSEAEAVDPSLMSKTSKSFFTVSPM